MGKTADLTVAQKTIIDTLHKEGKPQTFITKEAGCSQSAISKQVNRKLSGRKKCGRKRCTTNRENRSLMRIVKQNWFKNLGELHKEWTEASAWVKASRATTHRRVKEFGYSCHQRRLTWAKEKKNWTVAQWSKVLFSDKSKFCISFGNLESGGRVENLIAQVAWSPVLSLHSLWWFGVQCHLLVLVHCFFCKKTSLHPFTKKCWSTSCFLLLTSFLKMLISFSSRIWHLPTLPKKLVKWPWCWCAWLASKLTRPEPHRESMGYCQDENENQETKKCRWVEGHCQRNLGFHTTSAVPQTDHLHATPNWGSN